MRLLDALSFRNATSIALPRFWRRRQFGTPMNRVPGSRVLYSGITGTQNYVAVAGVIKKLARTLGVSQRHVGPQVHYR
jgi:hypothetical protein